MDTLMVKGVSSRDIVLHRQVRGLLDANPDLDGFGKGWIIGK